MKLHATRLALASSIAAVAIAGAAQAKDYDQYVVPANKVLARALAIETGKQTPRMNEPRLSSGALYAVLNASGELDRQMDSAAAKGAKPPKGGPRDETLGCQNTYKNGKLENVRVNQDCSLRRQAEAALAINPTNPDNMIAGQNDSRLGFNKCGYDFTFDGGKTWGDMVPPFYQFIMADGHTADACSDPTATFDGDGNAYVGGVLFDINSAASAFVVMKSNAGIGGAYYHTPRALSFQEYRNTPVGVVASDNDPNIFHDKEFIIADAGSASPKRNTVYATWTRFTASNSPIVFSQSTDGGDTWSPAVEISGANAAACTVGSVIPNACDQDQGSDPIVGADGTIYVSFGNGNTPLPGVNQVMLVKCPVANDCTLAASWSAPVKVGDLIGTHPVGPSAAGCPGGRGCLPPNGYRVPEFTSISAAVDSSNRLYVTWADFRNGGAPCTGPAATATPPCDNDVFYASSTDGGSTWSPAVKVTPAGSAQFMPWSGVTSDGSKLYIAYYDRSYGNCEFDGCNDITLATVSKAATGAPTFNYKRVTTSSMPNLTPATNPIQAGFLGDYMWLAVDPKGRANIVWSDTRGRNGTVEEDIYFARP